MQHLEATYRDHVLHLKGIVPSDLCSSIIKTGDTHISNRGFFKNDNLPDRQDTQLHIPNVFNNLSATDDRLFEYIQELTVYSVHLYAEQNHYVYDRNLVPRTAKWQRTNIGQVGFAPFHIEQASGGADSDRFLVWMIYLNDVDDGGETEFLYQRTKYKPSTGDMLVWPAGCTHPHRGNPPYSNDKYVLTGWLNCGSAYEDSVMHNYYTHIKQNGLDKTFTLFELPDEVVWK